MQKNINKIKDITIGTKLELEVTDIFNSDRTYTYVSQLLDTKGDDSIVIAAPISEGKLVFVSNNAKISVMFQIEKLGLLAFDGILEAKDTIDNISVFYIKRTSGFYKIQRRNHYRLDIMLDVYYAQMPEKLSDKIKSEKDMSFTKTFSKDISGSGACFISPEELPIDTPLVIKLDLPDGETIEARGVVVRCFEVSLGGSKKYNIGVKFTAISKINEEKLIRYIFIKQKEILKQKRV
jgi:Predicted glycosyltransferase